VKLIFTPCITVDRCAILVLLENMKKHLAAGIHSRALRIINIAMTSIILLSMSFLSPAIVGASDEPTILQFGTNGGDFPADYNGVAVDSAGNSYVVGYTDGGFPGFTNAGGVDGFLRKYDASGTEVWTRQLGTVSDEIVLGIKIGVSGVYVVGHTSGNFPGFTNAGGSDAFVRKYDSDGNILWTQQFGTSDYDGGTGIALDSAENVYISGSTNGGFPGFVNS